jgi:hypothetical protein
VSDCVMNLFLICSPLGCGLFWFCGPNAMTSWSYVSHAKPK